MKSKKILTLIFAVLLVFSLFGCGKKEPVEDVEPQDTTEQDLDDIKADKNTVDIDGKQYDISDPANNNVPQKTEVLLTTAELHALFKKEYDTERYAKSNLYADQYKDFYLKLPAREIGTQVDANVYSYIESTVKGAEYSGKILPDDGFEQYVAWREALEKGSSSGNNQSGNTSGNTGNTGNTGGQTQQKPSGGNGSSENSGGSSGNNGGSTGNSTGSSGGYYDNVYDGAVVEREVQEAGKGTETKDKTYEKPSYDIIG